MDCLGGDQLLAQLLGQLLRALDRLDKDDHLVELELVDQVRELLDLLVGGERHVVLLQAVEGQLGLVVHVDLLGLMRREEKTGGDGRGWGVVLREGVVQVIRHER